MAVKVQIVILMAVLALGVYIGTKLVKPVVQTVEVDHAVTQTNVVTVTHEVTHTDGTKETIITSTDKSVVKVDESKSTVVAQKDYFVVASATMDRVYGLSVNKRVLGPIFVGAGYQTNGTLSANIGMEF